MIVSIVTLYQCKLHSFVMMHCTVCTDQGRFPFNLKFQKIWLVQQMEWTISVWSDRNMHDQFWRSVRPKCPFPFDKIVVPSTTLLYPAYKNNNQMHGGLGWVCATGMYRSIGHVEFPNCQNGIFVEWKAPQGYHLPPIYETICSLVKTRLQITANITDEGIWLGSKSSA